VQTARADVRDAETGLTIRFRADPMSVRHTLTSLSAALEKRRPECDFGMFELVLAEVLNNVVEHAYAGREDGLVDLSVKPGATAVRVSVIDDGKPFPAGAPPQREFPTVEPGNPPEGGFGWPLIRSLTFSLRYRRAEGRNILTYGMAYEKRAPDGD
jgi:serine/threonine-protein kinase RsbW